MFKNMRVPRLGNNKRGRASRAQKGSVIIRQPMVADHLRVVLPYRDYYQFSITQATQVSLTINLNSVFAPVLATWTRAAQPRGRDQWVTFYNRYIVHRARVQLTVASSPASGLICGPCVIDQDIDNATGTLAAEGNIAVEASRFPLHGDISTYGSPTVKLDSNWLSLAALEGRTLEEYRANDSLYGAAVGATPTAVSVHHTLLSAPADAAQTNARGIILLTMYYDVEFYDSVQLAAS